MMTASVKFLAAFLVCELVAAALIVLYTIYPCCWPLSLREACLPHIYKCPTPPCLRKCCPLGEELFKGPERDVDKSSLVCVPTENSSFSLDSLPLWKNNPWNENYTRYTVISMGLCPYKMYKLGNTDKVEKHAILPNGSLLMINSMTIDSMDKFCVDAYHGQKTNVFKCLTKKTSPHVITELEKIVYPSALAFSLLFLVATAAVYLLLPKLRNLHGLCLLCHVFSLIVGYSILIPVQINYHDLNTQHPRLCELSAFILQVSFLASFFWLNVMCFDIWWGFSGLKLLRGSLNEQEHKKFILYSLYAWGGPLLIFGISLFMETASFIPKSFIKPQFGVETCWFKDWDAIVLYFYLPIGVLILLNIVIFMTTALHLRVHNQDLRERKSSESRCTGGNERKRFNLYFKLFIVMGINWSMEIVSFFVGGSTNLWIVTDIVNILQGLFIFLIFVCKRRILRMLNQKLCPQWQLVRPSSTSARSKVSNSTTSSLSKTPSSNPEEVALKPLPQTAVSEDSDTNN